MKRRDEDSNIVMMKRRGKGEGVKRQAEYDSNNCGCEGKGERDEKI